MTDHLSNFLRKVWLGDIERPAHFTLPEFGSVEEEERYIRSSLKETAPLEWERRENSNEIIIFKNKTIGPWFDPDTGLYYDSVKDIHLILKTKFYWKREKLKTEILIKSPSEQEGLTEEEKEKVKEILFEKMVSVVKEGYEHKLYEWFISELYRKMPHIFKTKNYSVKTEEIEIDEFKKGSEIVKGKYEITLILESAGKRYKKTFKTEAKGVEEAIEKLRKEYEDKELELHNKKRKEVLEILEKYTDEGVFINKDALPPEIRRKVEEAEKEHGRRQAEYSFNYVKELSEKLKECLKTNEKLDMVINKLEKEGIPPSQFGLAVGARGAMAKLLSILKGRKVIVKQGNNPLTEEEKEILRETAKRITEIKDLLEEINYYCEPNVKTVLGYGTDEQKKEITEMVAEMNRILKSKRMLMFKKFFMGVKA